MFPTKRLFFVTIILINALFFVGKQCKNYIWLHSVAICKSYISCVKHIHTSVKKLYVLYAKTLKVYTGTHHHSRDGHVDVY